MVLIIQIRTLPEFALNSLLFFSILFGFTLCSRCRVFFFAEVESFVAAAIGHIPSDMVSRFALAVAARPGPKTLTMDEPLPACCSRDYVAYQ